MAEKGIDMLVNVSDDGTSGGNMTLIGGMRSKSININATPIDITSGAHSDRFRNLITGGIRTVSISAGGVFEDDAAAELIRAHILGGPETLGYVQFVIPDFGTIAGPFHVSSFEFTGEHDGEITFNASFESAGTITWTAAV